MKKICRMFLVLALSVSCLCSGAAVFAAEAQPTGGSAAPASTRAEETKWFYRDNGGTLQKRLWSNTQGIWLTDWIDC